MPEKINQIHQEKLNEPTPEKNSNKGKREVGKRPTEIGEQERSLEERIKLFKQNLDLLKKTYNVELKVKLTQAEFVIFDNTPKTE